MTLRQRIEAVFRGERPDKMVWYGDLTYWHGAHAKIGDLPEKWRGVSGRSRMHRDLGIGEYVPGCCAFDAIDGEDVKVTVDEQDGICLKTWETPVGSLVEKWTYSPLSFSWGHQEFPVKKVEDLAVVRYIFSQRRFEGRTGRVRQMDEDLKEHGLPVIATHPSAMSTLYKSWIGLMNLSYMLMDAPEEIDETITSIRRAQEPMWQISADAPCDYVMLCENFTAESMAGLFEKYYRRHLTEKIEVFHQQGKKVMCHIDGTLKGLAEKLPTVGVDCLDAVTPKPVGDVAVSELRDLVGPEAIILGGLPGAMFAPPFTAKDMEAQVRDIIRHHKNTNLFMFGVADQVPPNGDLDLVRLVTQLTATEGKY